MKPNRRQWLANVYVDDMSFTVVPEPSSLALVSLGGLAFLAARRKRA